MQSPFHATLAWLPRAIAENPNPISPVIRNSKCLVKDNEGFITNVDHDASLLLDPLPTQLRKVEIRTEDKTLRI
jgi:hypothetical protein